MTSKLTKYLGTGLLAAGTAGAVYGFPDETKEILNYLNQTAGQIAYKTTDIINSPEAEQFYRDLRKIPGGMLGTITTGLLTLAGAITIKNYKKYFSPTERLNE